MGRYASTTTVPVERSKAEIEATLSRYGADQFMSGWNAENAVVGFRMNGKMCRFVIPLPNKDDRAFTTYTQGKTTYLRAENAARGLWEQACRQKWRALALVVKAKLEAVDAGISEFEDEFLANILLPDGTTFGAWARPQLDDVYLTGQPMPLLLPELAGSRGGA